MSMDEPNDAYVQLGLAASGDLSHLTEAEIRRAYRTRALALHPDKNKGDARAAQRFAALFAAYELLRDKERRAKIDNVRAARLLQEERREALGADRRRFRDDLEHREQELRTAPMDAAALARMQDELRELREDAAYATAPSVAVPHGAGAWARVPGYEQFLAGSTPFEEFESEVLGD